jgi:cytochrome c-type biogenesis protein CcmH
MIKIYFAALLLSMSTVFLVTQAEMITVGPEHEERFHEILEELRCLVCQNQTLADSSSELANDLRLEVKELLEQGASNEEIITFMSDRYGDFVLYNPPLKPRTFLLWFGPFLLLFGGVLSALLIIRKRNKMNVVGRLDDQAQQKLKDLLDHPDNNKD